MLHQRNKLEIMDDMAKHDTTDAAQRGGETRRNPGEYSPECSDGEQTGSIAFSKRRSQAQQRVRLDEAGGRASLSGSMEVASSANFRSTRSSIPCP
jgi:hypothetical protein